MLYWKIVVGFLILQVNAVENENFQKNGGKDRMKQVVLTQEINKKCEGRYLIIGIRMVRLGEIDTKLTPENFRAYLIDDDDIWQELTVDDFEWYDPENGDVLYISFFYIK